MKIEMSQSQQEVLRAFLEGFEDAERLSAREYVVDLYDISEPVSLDLVFVKGGVAVDGAAQLIYDATQDGWYMGERLTRPEAVRAALEQAGALA